MKDSAHVLFKEHSAISIMTESNEFHTSCMSLFFFPHAAVDVNEGEFVTVQAGNDMRYPNIDSCLTVTYAYNTGVRSGGHAVLFPQPGQQTLEQMVQSLNGMNRATIFYIMGAIEVWNVNYFGEAGRNFTINGTTVNLKNVESIVPALGYNAQTNAVLYDKDKYTVRPVVILFQANPRVLVVTDTTGKVLYNKPWPGYHPPLLKKFSSLL